MVTSDDFWEAAFRREVQKNRESSTTFSSSPSSSSRNNATNKRTDKGGGEGQDEGEGVADVVMSSAPSSSIPMVSSSGTLRGHSRDKDEDRDRKGSEKESVMTIEKQKVGTFSAAPFLLSLSNLVGLYCCIYHALPCPVLPCPASLTTYSLSYLVLPYLYFTIIFSTRRHISSGFSGQTLSHINCLPPLVSLLFLLPSLCSTPLL
jgi:hypothetical protein